MDLDSLRHFLELSRCLHFTRASRACHLSPSALSRSIQRLESGVGHRLFNRNNRSVSLTADGEAFRAYAADALRRWEAIQSRLAAQPERLTGRLRIFASATACHSFLPAILRRFRDEQPGIHLHLETGAASDALERLDGSIDISVAALPTRLPRDLESLFITRTPVLLIAPAFRCEVAHQLERRPIRWEEVPMVLPEFGLARQRVDRWLRGRKIEANVYAEVPSYEAILSLVALGCGVGVVPKLVVDKSPMRGDVRDLAVRPALPEFRVGFCTPRSKLRTPAVAAFWEVAAAAQ